MGELSVLDKEHVPDVNLFQLINVYVKISVGEEIPFSYPILLTSPSHIQYSRYTVPTPCHFISLRSDRIRNDFASGMIR